MPLDSYTLDDWFKEDVLVWYNIQNPSDKKTKGAIPSWSNLDQSTYVWIQDKIRKYLMDSKHNYRDNDGNPLTPL